MQAKQTPPADPLIICERCGATGAYIIAGEGICMDCYQGAGSCCAESEMEECEED